MYDGYRATIKEKLSGDELVNTQSVNDAIGVRYLANQLNTEQSAEKIIIALNLAELLEPGALGESIHRFLSHPDKAVKQKALQIVQRNQMLGLADEIREIATKEQDADIKNDLIDTEIALNQIKSLTIDEITLLVRAPEASDRELAAIWLGHYEHPQRLLLLRELASDKDISVAIVAVRSSASVKSIELWSLLIEFMHIPTLSNVAVPALVAEGADVVPVLEVAFGRFEKKPLALLKIIQICGRIGGERAIQFLLSQFDFPKERYKPLLPTCS